MFDLGIATISKRRPPECARAHLKVDFHCGCASWWYQGYPTRPDPLGWGITFRHACPMHP